MGKMRIVLVPCYYDSINDNNNWMNTGTNICEELECRRFNNENELKIFIKKSISAIRIYNLDEIVISTLQEFREKIFSRSLNLDNYFLGYCMINSKKTFTHF